MLTESTGILIALLVLLCGAWVQWRASWYRMDAEEAMKDGRLSQRQVDQRLRLARRGGWFLTLAGVAIFMTSLLCCNGR